MDPLREVNPVTGAVRTFEYDESEDCLVVKTIEDVTGIIEANKRALNDGTNGYNKDRDMVHVAHIPDAVAMKWYIDHGVKAWDRADWPAVKRLLNSSEWRYLRCSDIIL